MKNVWITILKPKGSSAKWLLFLMMTVILALGALGHFDVIKQYTDTESLSFKVGDYKISAYEAFFWQIWACETSRLYKNYGLR